MKKVLRILEYSFYTLLSFLPWLPFWLEYSSYEPTRQSVKELADAMVFLVAVISLIPVSVIWTRYSLH